MIDLNELEEKLGELKELNGAISDMASEAFNKLPAKRSTSLKLEPN